MKKVPFAVLGAALFLSTAAAAPVNLGGWATVTVDKAPDSLIVGKQTAFVFIVKQHGVRPMAGLKPTVTAKTVEYSDTTKGSARELKTEGSYEASITVPKRGEWLITIYSGWGKSDMTMKPIRAVDASGRIATR
jgi:hypothetical protein